MQQSIKTEEKVSKKSFLIFLVASFTKRKSSVINLLTLKEFHKQKVHNQSQNTSGATKFKLGSKGTTLSKNRSNFSISKMSKISLNSSVFSRFKGASFKDIKRSHKELGYGVFNRLALDSEKCKLDFNFGQKLEEKNFKKVSLYKKLEKLYKDKKLRLLRKDLLWKDF